MTDTAKYLNESNRLENVLRDAKIRLTTPRMEELVGA